MQGIGVYLFVSAFLVGVTIVSLINISWHVIALLVLIGSCIGLVAVRTRTQNHILACVCILSCAIGMARTKVAPSELPLPFVPLIDTKVTLQGVVVLMPDIRESSSRLTVEVTREGKTTRVIAATPLYPKMHVGDTVTVSGKFTQPKPFDVDGGRTFAYDQFLRKDGVFGVVQPAYVTIDGQSSNIRLRFMRVLESVKNRFTGAVAATLPEPESALAIGLVAGGKQGLGKELIDAFTIAGMLQVIVLSGYNVMIVAEYVLRILSSFTKRTASVIAALTIICFVLAAGAGSSALRAGIMALFALFARATGKQYHVLRIVSISLFLLVLWNPLLLVFDPGLQFSFLATLGLIIGTPLIAERMRFIKNKTFCEMLATTLAAQIGVLPFLLWQTGNLSLVAVVANLLVMPVIPFAMGFSALAAGIGIPLAVVSPILSLVAGFPAYILLTYVIHIATISARLPYAQIIIPAFPFWCVLISYVALILLVVYARKSTPLPEGKGVLRTPV